MSPAPEGVTDTAGQLALRFESLSAETKTVSLKVARSAGGDPADPLFTLELTLRVVAASPSPLESHLRVLPAAATPVVGVDSVLLEVELADAHGNPVPDWQVAFTASGSRNDFAPEAAPRTDPTGTASVMLTSLTAEEKSVAVEVAGVDGSFILEAPVTFVAGRPAASGCSATASPTMVPADGTARAEIILTVSDRYGNPVASTPVTAAVVGAGVLDFTSGLSSASGTFSTTLTSPAPGSGRVTFEVGDFSVGSPEVTFRAPAWYPANGTMWGTVRSHIAVPHAGGPAGLAYLGTNRGVYVTGDGGLSWSSASAGLGRGFVDSVAIASIDGMTAVASTFVGGTGLNGIFRTTNGGATWSPVLAASGQFGARLLTAAHLDTDAVLLHAVTWPNDLVYRSLDAGLTWSVVEGLTPILLGGFTAIVVDPATAATYVAGRRLYTDAGGSWHAAGVGLPDGVQALAIDATSSPSVLWVGTSDTGVYRGSVVVGGAINFVSASGSGGLGLPPNASVGALASDPSVAGTVYAYTGGVVYRTIDGGATWRPLSATGVNGSIRGEVHQIVVDPRDTAVGWLATEGSSLGGSGPAVWRSSNLTASPAAVTVTALGDGVDALPGDVLAIDGSSQGRLAVASRSLFESTDGGSTWIDLISERGIAPTGTSLGPTVWRGIGFDGAGTLYGFAYWRPLRVPPEGSVVELPPAPTFVELFGVSPALAGTLFAAGGGAGTAVYRCVDPCNGGWTTVGLPPGIQFVRGLAFGRAAGAVGLAPIFVHGGGGLARSTDGGVSFAEVEYFSGIDVFHVAADPLDGDRFIVSPLGGGIFLTSDGGQTFRDVGTSFPNSPLVTAIDSRSTPITLYAAIVPFNVLDTRMYRSSDLGETWNEAGFGLGLAQVYSLLPDLAAPGQVIYAGSAWGGIFKSESGGL